MVIQNTKLEKVMRFVLDYVYSSQKVTSKLSRYGLTFRKDKTEKDILDSYRRLYKKYNNDMTVDQNIFIDLFAEDVSKNILKEI